VEPDDVTVRRDAESPGPSLHAVSTPASTVAISTVHRSPRMIPHLPPPATCGAAHALTTPIPLDPMTDPEEFVVRTRPPATRHDARPRATPGGVDHLGAVHAAPWASRRHAWVISTAPTSSILTTICSLGTLTTPLADGLCISSEVEDVALDQVFD
jgi:hypothetical protein